MMNIFEEAECISHHYRQKKYWKFSRDGIYKLKLQAKILKNSKETQVFPYKTYYQKYEPTEDEPRKDWKKLHLSGGRPKNST